jgi:Domain of unknown function (DUF4158)
MGRGASARLYQVKPPNLQFLSVGLVRRCAGDECLLEPSRFIDLREKLSLSLPMNTTEKLSNIFYTVLGRRTHNRFQNLDVVQTIFRWEGNRPFVEDGFSESIKGVFAYPRKKVQSRISSRLENDPLPLLSVFIDNMHVDEVQINGGGTEAVITGNMENPGKRLIVREGDAVEALYGRPLFTHEERVQYFALSPKEKSVLDQPHSIKSRVYFILQLGYFKARRMFFIFHLNEVDETSGTSVSDIFLISRTTIRRLPRVHG